MKAIQTCTLLLDLNMYIVDANPPFLELFNLQRETIIQQPFMSAGTMFAQLQQAIEGLYLGQHASFVFLTNHTIEQHNSMFMFYVTLTKKETGYIIKFINWLNWLHNVNESLEIGYNFVANLNENTCQSKFDRISGLCCFKALYPLLAHVPRKFKANSLAIYDILHLFMKKDNNKTITKDYNRNVLSRIHTQLRRETGNIHLDIIDAIKNDRLIMIKYKNNISIPNTTLKESILLPIKPDQLLESVV